ncbi:hypothetical protein R3P38DRAFT_2921307 [Favolaschia claudopus]|uniref:Uncharacterized protein n=1 Tax=Favolaschia claudopus TaxID=2862362 RepID=A0AAW0C2L4_9AGAR
MNYLKLDRASALLRIRRNSFALLLIAVLSILIPTIPALPTALTVVLYNPKSSWHSIYSSFCILEVGAVVVFSLNILQGLYAVKYPRAPPPPSPTPAKSKAIRPSTQTPKRAAAAFRLSPNSSPQLQKSFSSFSASASALHSQSPNASKSSLSGYPVSPASTPSKVLSYSIPPSSVSSSTSTFLSSSSINTPSPILATYLGKHGGDHTARSFDGAFLEEIRRQHQDDSDEE